MLRADGASVDVSAAASAPRPNDYDGVVIGGSIHAGKYGPALNDYVKANVAALNAMLKARAERD